MTVSAATGTGPDTPGRNIAFGQPSAALLARAGHGHARFLARRAEPAGSEDARALGAETAGD
ncbi:hypothetical protein ABT169_26365 [Streptomyces sp. NPDC001616]|uniref:hypothetical protein n=1 Tax=Streptomyces sp. NPDC001616 TaxID=3156648 RepID=UPI0033207AF4